MQDENYFKAVLPKPAVCLKLPLRPFSIGHYLLLARARSPFVYGDRAPTFSDLMEAVFICAGTFEEGRRLHEDPLARLKIWIWGKRIRKADIVREEIKFHEYLTNSMIEPDLRPGSGRTPGSPWLLRLKQFLVQTMRLSESEAWNYPYAAAVWEYCAHYESLGACEVRNADEIKFMKWVEEQEAKAAEEKPQEEQNA